MRPLSIVLLALLGLVLLAGAALWLLRLPLAEWGLARWLEGRGLEGSAEVVRLDLEGAELTDLVLDGQAARRVRIAYDLPALVRTGALEGLEVEGLRLAADLTAERPLGRLPEAFAGEAAGSGEPFALPVLPPVTLADAELALATARGPLRLRLDGGLAPAPDAPLANARRLDLTLDTLEGPLRLGGHAEGLYVPGDGSGSRLDLTLESRDGPPVSVAASGAIAEGILDLSFDLAGDAPLLAGLAALPAGSRPEAGRLALRGRAEAETAALLAGEATRLLTDPEALRALDLALTLEGVALPGRGRDLTLDSGLVLEARAEGRRLRLAPLAASAGALDAGWLAALGLPAPLAEALAGGGRLAVTSPGGAPLVLPLGEDPPRLEIDLAADLAPSAGGNLQATLTGSLLAGTLATLPPEITGRLDGTLAAAALDLPGLGRLAQAEGGFLLALSAEETSLTLDRPLAITGLEAAAPLLAGLDPGWRPLLERPLDVTVGAAGQAAGSLVQSQAGMRIALPAALDLAAGEASLRAELDGSLALSETGTLEQADVRLAGLTAAALPTPYGELRSLALSGRFEGVPEAANGRATARFLLADLAAEGAGAPDLEGEIALDLGWDAQALTLSLSEPGRLALSGFAEPLAPLVERLELALAGASLSVGANLELAAEAALEPTGLNIDGRGGQDDLILSAGSLTLDLTRPEGGEWQGTVVAGGLDARLAEPAATLRGARLVARLQGSEVDLELAGATLASSAEPPLFPALALSGSGELAGQALRYRLRGRGLEGALDLAATGRQDFEAGAGSAEVTVAPLVFQTGGLQPGDLHPALADLERATGSASARLALRLGGTTRMTGGIELSEVGFTAAGATVEGLDLDLALESLSPPASPPGQPFSIARIDVGVPLTGVTGTLQLRPAGAASELLVERAEAGFLDGRLAVENALLDPAAKRYDVTLLVEGVDLERLLALADLPEVSGSGRLSGAIPVSLVEGALVIREGALEARSPGVIAFRSEEARQALASGGEQVELMLQALEDFRYQVLRLSVDKPAEGDSSVFLKLEGHNPAVLDGQPFVLNVNLTSNAAPLLAALARGTEISDSLVEELLQGRGLGVGR
ncbi:MAG: YdbH domain-containing protein [Tistlia sp.]|uniref:intermembrane phospholipid transport protein YdbH family protein n=1 Tax=Tistlia sp. TaxID=3057121 RepID=UPI0034A24BBA